jgi:hypothetical protein
MKNPNTPPLVSFPYLPLFKNPFQILLIAYLLLGSRFELIGLIKGIQLLLPFLIAPLLPVFSFSGRLNSFLFKVYLCAVLLFVGLHLLSYFYYTDYLGDDSVVRFTAFWDSSIYSAHISWSSYLGFLLAFMCLFYLTNIVSFPMFLLSFLTVAFELILSTRRDPFVAFISFISVLLLYILRRITSTMRLSWSALLFSLILAISASVIAFFFDTYLLYLERIFDFSDRLEIWEILGSSLQSKSFILFGMMFPYNNLHSYPLSLIYSYGLIGCSVFCLSAVSFLRFFAKLNNSRFSSSKFNGFPGYILILALLFSACASNLVNVSLSQPFYLINFLFLFLLFQSTIAHSPSHHCSSS